MKKSAFPPGRWPRLPIRTPRLKLRLPEATDAEAIHRACADPSTRWGVHSLPRPYRRRHALQFIREKRLGFRARQSLALVISEGEDGPLVGAIELLPHSAMDRVAELGYWIAPEQRGKGYATEAARAMCDLGFHGLRLHRIEARALIRNRASIRVLEKAGLQREGVFRERARVANRWLDEVRLARLAPK